MLLPHNGCGRSIHGTSGKFAIEDHALCWVHAERLIHKLDTFTDKQYERHRAGVGSARDPLSPNLVDASFSDEGDPLGRLSVICDRRIMIS
jgi:hypothetical protein